MVGLVLALAVGVTSEGLAQSRSKSKKAKAKAKVEEKLPVLPNLPDPKGVFSESASIVDYRTGRVIWSKNGTKSMYPASTTKIMTGMLLVDSCQPDELITAPQDVQKVGEASLHLLPGEQLSARNMMWGIMLRSANDGCYAVACHISGSQEAFAELMNKRAKEIGCVNTHFRNPNGLPDNQHWTCSNDLAIMAREALKRPWFAETVRNWKHTIARSMNTKDVVLMSKNRILREDPTADGVKTGYTKAAGCTYVGSATRNGERFITSIMKSPHWAADHKKMMDWAFAAFEHKLIAKRGELVGKVTAGSTEVPVLAGRDLWVCVEKVNPAPYEVVIKADPKPETKVGDIIGEGQVIQGSFKQKFPVVASPELVQAMAPKPVLAVAKSSATWMIVGGAALLGVAGVVAIRRRRPHHFG
jgi:D-alanyl-D-alanine carboxypeptidase (penicillin-binding protein 5/6)